MLFLVSLVNLIRSLLYLVAIFCSLFFVVVVQVQLSPFSPHHSPTHPCLPPLNLPTLALSVCPLYMFLDGLSPVFPHYPSPHSPLVTVSLFFISMSLVIFCFLVCLYRFLIGAFSLLSVWIEFPFLFWIVLMFTFISEFPNDQWNHYWNHYISLL